MKHLVLALLVVLGSGCATTSSITKGINDPLAQTVDVSTYDFDKPFYARVNIASGQDVFYRSSFIKKTSKQTYQIYMVIRSLGGFEDWNKLVYLDARGNRQELSAARVDYDVHSSTGVHSYFEDVIVSLTESEVSYFATKNITVRMISKRSTNEMDIVIDAKETNLLLSRIAATKTIALSQ